METAPRERIAVMTTIRKIAFAVTAAAGLLVSASASAGDISSDRHLTRPQPQRHPAAAAVTAPVQEAKAAQDQPATAKAAPAHPCACAHGS